jgi:hypothetical protein
MIRASRWVGRIIDRQRHDTMIMLLCSVRMAASRTLTWGVIRPEKPNLLSTPASCTSKDREGYGARAGWPEWLRDSETRRYYMSTGTFECLKKHVNVQVKIRVCLTSCMSASL